jgi:hypothetical protein
MEIQVLSNTNPMNRSLSRCDLRPNSLPAQIAPRRVASINPFIGNFFKFAAAIISVMLVGSAFAAPATGVLDETHPGVWAVMAAQAEVTQDLMRKAEILGTAVGVNATGFPVLMIYVDRDSPNTSRVIRDLPREFRGVSVQVHLTDKFRAMAHTAKQTPPIQLGTSGGWSKDLANGFCCGGTLGSLVKIGSTQYILSNYHVFESDIVPGGNGIVATTGDPIIQPGLIDLNCSANGAQTVGTLVKKSSLPGSNVDCAIAKVVPGMVRTDGAILEIGTISTTTVGAFVNQAGKKSGRTTGLTHSSVSGLNATVSVAYDNECAGGTAFTKVFTGQIVVANSGNHFLNSGDSGSLMVEDVATKPRAIGLLFAGSNTTAIANPIGQVLTFLGATMVGGGTTDTNDFNGDGHPDYVLYNANTRQTAIWYLNNNVRIAGANGPTLPGASWSLVDVADFNGDGHPDYVLYNANTRQTAIWYLSNNVRIAGANGPTLPAGWSLMGVADFNGDGHPDYVLYNANTRQTAIWYLNNNVRITGANGPALPAGWSLVEP